MNIASANQSLVASIIPQFSTNEQDPNEEDILKNTDLELAMKKRLLDSLLGTNKNEKDNLLKKFFDSTEEKDTTPQDTVEISDAAVEMYSQQSINLQYSNGIEKLDIQFERVEAVRIESIVSSPGQQAQQADPLVFDLDGNGIELTNVLKGDGVQFDLTGDGTRETVSWLAPSEAFLAFDRNDNGLVDSGNELFGNQHDATNGFEELRKFDSNNDGSIDSNDNIFNELLLWRDINSNGTSEQDELAGLEKYGIKSISLSADSSREVISGNLIAGYSQYNTTVSNGRVGEVFLNYLA